MNDAFLFIYTPSNFEMDHAPDSTFVYATRQPKTTNFTFQKLADPCPPFGMNRSPPFHFIQRLREFPPALSDVLFLSSTASGDVGLVICSHKPLSGDDAAVQAASKQLYITTSLAVDSRRAQLPVNDEMSDTSPIGFALDLSSSTMVKRPIPGEEIDETATPLPNLMVLNNEGVLSSWWFVYSDSVRQGLAYPGLVAAAGQQQGQLQAGFGSSTQSAFGASTQSLSGFGSAITNGFAKSSAPGFGGSGSSGTPAFGSNSVFGAATTLGSKPSLWGASTSASAGSAMTGGATFGQPAFGSGTPSAFGQPAFGSTTALGGNNASGAINRNLLFGAPTKPAFGSASALGTTTTPVFGSVSALGATNKPVFGSASTLGSASKPAFGSASSLGTGGGFGAVGGLGQTTSPWASSVNQTAANSSGSSGLSGFGGFANYASDVSPFGRLGASNASATGTFGSQISSNVTASQPAQISSFGAGNSLTHGTSSTFGTPSSLGGVKPLGFQIPSSSAENSLFGRRNTPVQDKDDDMMDVNMSSANATPPVSATPAGKSPALFGSTSGFTLNSSFKTNPTASSPLTKPDGDDFMGSGFGDALKSTDKSTVSTTTIKQEPIETSRFEELPATPPTIPKVGANSPKSFFPPVTPSVNESKSKTGDTPAIVPEPAPLPPSPKLSSPRAVTESAPLPPSPKFEEDDKDEFSPAGSPPVDLGAPGESLLSSAASVTSELVDDPPLPPDFLSASPALAEQSKSTATPPLPTSSAPGEVRPTGAGTTTRAPTWASPKPATSTEHSTSANSPSRAPSQQPENAIKPPTLFQPPTAEASSPRSPSPVRNRQALGRNPSFLSPVRGTGPLMSSTPIGTPSLKPGSRIAVPPTSPFAKKLTVLVNRAELEPDASYLSDDEDERIRAELAEPVEPTKRVEHFIAHQDYAGKVAGQGVPAQIEKVYRDINGMIDTLGINARSLGAFIKGHSEMFADGGREKEHLEKEDDWCLIEIEDLAIVQKDISAHLDAERPQDVKQKLAELQALQKELIAMRIRNSRVHKVLRARTHPEEASLNKPNRKLTEEQSAMLGDLRKQFSSLQKNLAKAEDATSLLAAKLAAHEAGPGSGRAVPTVEAVVNTISKMTRMTEQKRGDLDVIEHQMRRLRFRPGAATFDDLDIGLGALSLGGNDDGGSPFATPPSSRKSKTAGTYKLSYDSDTPSASPSPARERNFRWSLTGSARARARHEDVRANVSREDVEAFKARRDRRKKVLGLLREKIVQKDGAEQQDD